MEERHRDDGFEATFVVSVTREEVWKRLVDAQPAVDWLPPAAPGQWWIPGVEAPGDELDVQDGHRLHVRKAVEPCKGTEIVITMEDADTGTRITYVQHGFGPDFERARPWLEAGWWAIRADLFLYLDRGVRAGRHLRPWGGIGCEIIETPAGLEVVHVHPDTCAERAGLGRGDLLLTIDGSPALTTNDFAVLTRGSMRRVDTVKLRYVRGTDILEGIGATS